MVTKNLGMLFLAIYLILSGLVGLAPGFIGLGPVLPVLGLLAGVFILLGK